MSSTYVPVRQDIRKMRYIRWLTTPPTEREPRTEQEFAREIDVYAKTLYNWRQDRDFREVWADEADEVIGGEDKRQRVMDTLYEAASDPRNPRHVQAAKLYLEAIGEMKPARLDVVVSSKAIGMLTDDEIERYIAAGLQEHKQAGTIKARDAEGD